MSSKVPMRVCGELRAKVVVEWCSGSVVREGRRSFWWEGMKDRGWRVKTVV